ncbi:MAG: NUDIX hydrolase [Crenarchaeota archaeon]|nr:NUDIX hydrolase [Thermoproteota archaeon]
MKVVKRGTIYEGRIIRLCRYVIETPEGLQERDIVEHRGAVAMLAFVKDNTILLEYRYRPALDKHIYELPAGILKPGESIEECAKRELLEETGYEARRIEKLISFYPTPGYTNEIIHIVIMRDLERREKPQAEMSPEEKYMEIREVDIDTALEMIRRGEIVDGKTIIGILAYEMLKR